MEYRKLFNAQIYCEILKFFHENPNAIDTARGVATWTNLDRKKVIAALKKLEKHSILISHKVSSTIGYSYTRNKATIKKVSDFLAEKI